MRSLVMSDYDGTWDKHPEIRSQVEAIITGSSWEQHQDIMDSWEGKSIPIFYNPTPVGDESLLNIVNHKADIINKTGCTKFFENQPQQVSMLKILCPNCSIIQVRDDATAL